MTEFVHLLLTGAFHSEAILGIRGARVDVEPGPKEAVGADRLAGDGVAAAVLDGGVRGPLLVAVRPEGEPGDPLLPPGDATEAAYRLLADFTARIGRLLGVSATMAPMEEVDAGDGEEGGAGPWTTFAGRIVPAGGGPGAEVEVALSPSLTEGIFALLVGDEEAGPGSFAAGGGLPPAAAPTPSPGTGGYGAPWSGPEAAAGAPGAMALRAVQWDRFTPPEDEPAAREDGTGISFIGDLPLSLTVELGRARVTIEEIIGWRPGSVLELERLAGEMLDVLINGRPIAKGEIVVVEDVFNVKITDIVSPSDRLRQGASGHDE